ncbi:MAG: hypothetical protein KC800_23840 [Candidatus Eremiobacteraeota bacterium]|nr:hypothetical protein [Candidatus Eremiobacteraeota bacterium]
MRISSSTSRPLYQPRTRLGHQRSVQAESADRVTLSGKLGKIAKGAVIGAAIGATATAIGFVGALTGGTGALLGIAGSTLLGIGLAHKMDMMVPSTFVSPSRAGREKTFYGATGGIIGGAFGATMAGLGLMTGGGAAVAAAIGIGYGSALAATRNTIMGIGEQFPNAL